MEPLVIPPEAKVQVKSILQIAAELYTGYVLMKSEKIFKIVALANGTVRIKYEEDPGSYLRRLCALDFQRGPVECSYPEHYATALHRAELSQNSLGKYPPNNFIVEVREMEESHRYTYWVTLLSPHINQFRVSGTENSLCPMRTENVENANSYATTFAQFLGVKATLFEARQKKAFLSPDRKAVLLNEPRWDATMFVIDDIVCGKEALQAQKYKLFSCRNRYPDDLSREHVLLSLRLMMPSRTHSIDAPADPFALLDAMDLLIENIRN